MTNRAGGRYRRTSDCQHGPLGLPQSGNPGCNGRRMYSADYESSSEPAEPSLRPVGRAVLTRRRTARVAATAVCFSASTTATAHTCPRPTFALSTPSRLTRNLQRIHQPRFKSGALPRFLRAHARMQWRPRLNQGRCSGRGVCALRRAACGRKAHVFSAPSERNTDTVAPEWSSVPSREYCLTYTMYLPVAPRSTVIVSGPCGSQGTDRDVSPAGL